MGDLRADPFRLVHARRQERNCVGPFFAGFEEIVLLFERFGMKRDASEILTVNESVAFVAGEGARGEIGPTVMTSLGGVETVGHESRR